MGLPGWRRLPGGLAGRGRHGGPPGRAGPRSAPARLGVLGARLLAGAALGLLGLPQLDRKSVV